jgi:pimeloyl-ACP methyl ester carboxylesterase
VQDGNLQAVRDDAGTGNAVIFLHGFGGNRDDTWDRFPGFLGTKLAGWDIYTLGYATTFLPDIVGIWSADPDIPIIATLLRTRMSIEPLNRYSSLAIIAHSMGGLVVQRALLDDAALSDRVRHVILFGTPSGGLVKSRPLQFWKRQLKNMAIGSEFIETLRREWHARFNPSTPFAFLSVAGSKDQFVPPASSLEPFAASVRRVVSGDHLSMVKPAEAATESVLLVAGALSPAVASPASAIAPLRIAAEVPSARPPDVKAAVTGPALSESEVMDTALALERAGRRDESIKLLERHQTLGTDVQGGLAGRMKRIWFENQERHYAERALQLYEGALATATAVNDHKKNDYKQAYYHAINVAFLHFVAFDNPQRAREFAELALACTAKAEDKDGVWNLATQAEAQLYLGNKQAALDLYRKLPGLSPQGWQLASTGLQAGYVAAKLKDPGLLESLDAVFTPNARQVNKIFVSYSHKNAAGLKRLQTHLSPYLRAAERELDLWDDTRLKPGDQWRPEIEKALQQAGVAVMLVSADFLDSDFIMQNELPVLVKAAEQGDLQLLWVHLSAAAYEPTPIAKFQAAYKPDPALDRLPKAKREQALKEIAAKIKEAALGATERFTH